MHENFFLINNKQSLFETRESSYRFWQTNSHLFFLIFIFIFLTNQFWKLWPWIPWLFLYLHFCSGWGFDPLHICLYLQLCSAISSIYLFIFFWGGGGVASFLTSEEKNSCAAGESGARHTAILPQGVPGAKPWNILADLLS